MEYRFEANQKKTVLRFLAQSQILLSKKLFVNKFFHNLDTLIELSIGFIICVGL